MSVPSKGERRWRLSCGCFRPDRKREKRVLTRLGVSEPDDRFDSAFPSTTIGLRPRPGRPYLVTAPTDSSGVTWPAMLSSTLGTKDMSTQKA